MRTRAGLGRILACLLVLAGSSSCVLRGPSGVRRDVARATGAEYEREFGMTLGRMSLAVARWGLRVAENDAADDGPEFSLDGVRKVQVGVYRVEEGTWRDDHARFDPTVLGEWEPVVAIQDDGEDVHVLLRTEHGEIRKMLLVVSEDDELVIVRMAGRLDHILHDALRYGLEEAGRSDLYEPARMRLAERTASP